MNIKSLVFSIFWNSGLCISAEISRVDASECRYFKCFRLEKRRLRDTRFSFVKITKSANNETGI